MTFNFKRRGKLKSQLVLLYGSREFVQMIDDDYRGHLGRNMCTNSTSFFYYLLFLSFFQLYEISFTLFIYIHSVSTMFPLPSSPFFQSLLMLYILDIAKLEKGVAKG